jgi:hypothetical protein
MLETPLYKLPKDQLSALMQRLHSMKMPNLGTKNFLHPLTEVKKILAKWRLLYVTNVLYFDSS